MTEGLALMSAPRHEFESVMATGLSLRLRRFGTGLLCYSPTGYPYSIRDHSQVDPYAFVSASVTGTSCSLMCDHCRGRYLTGMRPATTPDALLKLAEEVQSRGGQGLLVSGGSDSAGQVPLKRVGHALSKIRNEMGLKVVVHTGIVDVETADMLSDAQVDAAMLDVIGDERVAREVYHLHDGPARMAESLKLLSERGVPTVPHVLVGLDYGRLSGELAALQTVADCRPSAVVVIVLSPIRKTPMANVTPPSPEAVGRVLTVARLAMQDVPILLGCARPLGEHKIQSDEYAVRSGVNGIAYVSQRGVDVARELGLVPQFMDVCCSLAPLHVYPPKI